MGNCSCVRDRGDSSLPIRNREIELQNRNPDTTQGSPHRPVSLLLNRQPDNIAQTPHYQNLDLSSYILVTHVALYDYDARTELDLSFRKGDYLDVAVDSGEGWWLARSFNSGKEGFIPCNYIAKTHTLQSEPWFFGNIKRADAERKLMLPQNNKDGTFLIRESESKRGNYTLSIRCRGNVRHYLIKQEEGKYVIDSATITRPKFHTLAELTRHHMRNPNGLNLQRPCNRQEKPPTFGLSFKTVKNWEIDRQSLILKHKLGSGNFGEVWEGLWNNVTPVAIKTLKQETTDREEFFKEATIMKELRHPKLIQLYAMCTVGEPICIVTELMKNGALVDFLRKHNEKSLKLPELINMSLDVASGMAYLESKKYIHRDLAARNVLVGENNVCKVADFGLARLIKDDVYTAHVGAKFPIKWTAPEAVRFNKFTMKSDVWSFGIFLFEIVTYGKVPYPGMSNKKVVENVALGYRMPRPPNCPEELYSIMLECWKLNPEDRPSFKTLQYGLEEF